MVIGVHGEQTEFAPWGKDQRSSEAVVRQPFATLELRGEWKGEAALSGVRRNRVKKLRSPEADPEAAYLGQFPGGLKVGVPGKWRVGLENDVDSRKVMDASQ